MSKAPHIRRVEARNIKCLDKGPIADGVVHVPGSSEPSTLISGYLAKITVADPFVLPVMAAFRVFLREGEWLMSMEEAWRKYRERLIHDPWKAYGEEGKSSTFYTGRSAKASWAPVCDHTKECGNPGRAPENRINSVC